SSQAITAIVGIGARPATRGPAPGCLCPVQAIRAVTLLAEPGAGLAEAGERRFHPLDYRSASPPGKSATKISFHRKRRRPAQTRPGALEAAISSRITSPVGVSWRPH